MRIPKIEPPQLRAPIHKQKSDVWISKQISPQHAVFEAYEFRKWSSTLSPADGQFSRLAFRIGAQFELPFQNNKFDRVVLKYTLNHVSELESQRKVIDECLRILKPGGAILSVARACDSGQDIAEEMVRVGVPPTRIGLVNLGNKDIAVLKPKMGVFLSDFKMLRKRPNCDPDVVRGFLQDILKLKEPPPLDNDQIQSFPDLIRAKVLDIALVWVKEAE